MVGLAPSLLFLAIAPARFAYDTVGAHGHRSGGGLVGEFGQKARVVENVLGIGTPGGAVPQFLLLAVCALAAAAAAYVLRVRIPLSLLIGAALAIGNLAPTPTYTQYFGITVPFLIAGTIELFGVARSSRARALDAGLRRALVGLVTVATAFYAAIGIVELQRSASLYRDQQIGSVEAVSRIVEEQTAPGDRVLASWPGYLFDTDARPVAGLESDFASDTAAHLTPDEAHRNLRASAADIEAMIRRHETRLLVVKPWHVSDAAPDWWGTAERSGYRLITEVPAGNSEVGGAVRIYRYDGP